MRKIYIFAICFLLSLGVCAGTYYLANADTTKSYQDEIDAAKSDLLWINPNRVNDYQKLPATNARLEKLRMTATFASSDGWKVPIPGTLIQRVALLMVTQ